MWPSSMNMIMQAYCFNVCPDQCVLHPWCAPPTPQATALRQVVEQAGEERRKGRLGPKTLGARLHRVEGPLHKTCDTDKGALLGMVGNDVHAVPWMHPAICCDLAVQLQWARGVGGVQGREASTPVCAAGFSTDLPQCPTSSLHRPAPTPCPSAGRRVQQVVARHRQAGGGTPRVQPAGAP